MTWQTPGGMVIRCVVWDGPSEGEAVPRYGAPRIRIADNVPRLGLSGRASNRRGSSPPEGRRSDRPDAGGGAIDGGPGTGRAPLPMCSSWQIDRPRSPGRPSASSPRGSRAGRGGSHGGGPGSLGSGARGVRSSVCSERLPSPTTSPFSAHHPDPGVKPVGPPLT